MDLKPAHLRSLSEVARTGTIAAAAESLGYTPSAISQQMAALERVTGRDLLEPVGRKVRLTDAGRVLVVHARRVLGALEETQAALEASGSEVRGVLQVGVFESVASLLLPPLLEAIAGDYPGLRVCAHQVEPDDATEAVAAGSLDAAFVLDFASESSGQGLQRTHVCHDWFRVVLADHDPITEQEIDLRRLEGRDLIVDSGGSAGGGYVLRACRDAGFEPVIRHELHDYPAVLRLVSGGGVVALVPDLALVAVPPAVRVIDPVPGVSRDVHLITRPSSSKRPSVAALMTAVARVATDLGLDTTR
jgi:DNA-binding transcriptional LysR family regulator